MVEIGREDFCVDEIIKKLKAPKIGAVSIYLGTVREFPQGVGLEFADNAQATQKLREIRQRAIDRFDLEDVAIAHRVGLLGVSESIVLVAVSASHREAAFTACSSIIDDIKDLHESWVKVVFK
jgi:molybdopterin synthase catalytic subunit